MPVSYSNGPNDPPAANFGFTFEYGMCYLEVLDTFEHTFRREVGLPGDSAIPLALTEGEMRAVYDKLMAIDFFSYPSRFSVAAPRSGRVGRLMPAARYRLTVRNASRMQSVAWEDNLIVDPMPPAATGLRELFALIIGIVKTQPGVQFWPRPPSGCP